MTTPGGPWLLEWKLYYSRYLGPDELNFYTVSSLDKPWEEAPQEGVACVVSLDPARMWGPHLYAYHERYYKVPHRGVMFSESEDLIRIHVPAILASQIKHGGNAFRTDWPQIMRAASEDADFPRGRMRRRKSDQPQSSFKV